LFHFCLLKRKPIMPGIGDMPVIPRATWEAARADCLARLHPWADDRLRRMSRREKHPVYDFLFEYYSFRPAQLVRWSPGFGVILEGATREDVPWDEFEANDCGLTLRQARLPEQRIAYLTWAVGYLDATLHRAPTFACGGAHEWAMVYRDPNVRHAQVPLRLSRDATDAVVESQPLLCSHFDAFRFFTPPAVPLNRWELTRAATTEHDQPGCLHVNMDLYRFAYKLAPFCPYSVLADAFELALAAREIDMRASPYDLSGFGFSPIPVETVAGRAEYAELQRELYHRARPIRERLLDVYRNLLDRTADHDHVSRTKFGLYDGSTVE
jgi:hypothetical protein